MKNSSGGGNPLPSCGLQPAVGQMFLAGPPAAFGGEVWPAVVVYITRAKEQKKQIKVGRNRVMKTN